MPQTRKITMRYINKQTVANAPDAQNRRKTNPITSIGKF